MTLSSSVEAAQLRQRATKLRALAQRLHALRIIDCYRAAGTETWVGPSPQRCDDALRGFPTLLHAQADALSVQARRLDHLAAEIEQRALLTGPH